MAPGGRLNRRLSIAIRVAAIAAVAAGLWWFIRAMDFAALGRAFRTAKLWPLVLAAALNFACLWGKAVVWRLMLAPRHVVKITRLFRLTIATFAASAIAPARAGEVLRVWSLKRRDGVPVADTAAVAVTEKLLDGITMVILAAPVPWLVPGLPSRCSSGSTSRSAGSAAPSSRARSRTRAGAPASAGSSPACTSCTARGRCWARWAC